MDREAWWPTVRGLQRIGRNWSYLARTQACIHVHFYDPLCRVFAPLVVEDMPEWLTHTHTHVVFQIILRSAEEFPNYWTKSSFKSTLSDHVTAYIHLYVLIAQSYLSVFYPMDCSPPGSSVHGILQAKIFEWVAISFSRGSSQFRDQTPVSWTAGKFFTAWATREASTY